MKNNKQNLETLIESLVKEELMIQEGLFSNIKKAIGFASKMAYVQATRGPEAVKDELIAQLQTFIQKAKSSKLNFAMNDLLEDLEEQVAEIKSTKARARDAKGKFIRADQLRGIQGIDQSMFEGKTFKKKILVSEAVGREFNHLEDLVFIEGSSGAMRAIEALEELGQDAKAISIKWDGNPTIYWGNDPETGEFVMVGKNGWGRNKSTSAEDLRNFITNSGKGEPWRQQFGSDMAQVFDILKAASPPSFVGFVFGDMLYHPGKPFQLKDNALVFTPNLVTYKVDTKSALGKRLGSSKVGVVAHMHYKNFGDKSGTPIANVQSLNSRDALILGQTYISHQPEIDVSEVEAIRSLVSSGGSSIDKFLEPVAGLSDMSGILYAFVNKMSKSNRLSSLTTESFLDWISLPESKLSPGKQEKILKKIEENDSGLDLIFEVVTRLMEAKNSIIDQVDSAEGDVVATTGDSAGGEGYVDTINKLKLVPRHRWKPS